MIIGEKECKEALENLRMLERKDNFKKWGGQVAPQISCDIFEQLIEKYFKSKENTLEFKNFKLHADNTLKSMLKDELISYIHMLHHNWSVSDEQLFNVIEKIKTLQDELDAIKNPKPYKFEELHKGMWVWDDVFKEMCFIYSIVDRNKIYVEYLESHCSIEPYKVLFFEENSFFPVTKALEYQE